MADEKEMIVEETTTTTETKTETKVDDRDKEIEKLKRLLSNANSEAKSYKDKLREKQTEEERKAADLAEKQAQMEAELEGYRKRETIANHKAKFIGLGFDEDTALKSAEALVSGDTETMFANFKTLTDNIAKNAITKAMDSQKGLTTGQPLNSADKQKAEDAALRRAFGL